MINLYPASNTTRSLRDLLDQLEKHLRSLEVIKQNVNQDVFVYMIRAKLPEDVLLQLEMLKGAKKKWTVYSLLDKLLEYSTAREHSEKKGKVLCSREIPHLYLNTERNPILVKIISEEISQAVQKGRRCLPL